MSNVQNPTKVNEHRVKISAGYIYLDKPLEQDQEVTLVVQGEVTKIEQSSTGISGEVDKTYIVKGRVAQVVDMDKQVLYKDECG